MPASAGKVLRRLRARRRASSRNRTRRRECRRPSASPRWRASRGSVRARLARTRRRRLPRSNASSDARVHVWIVAGFRPSRPALLAMNTVIGTPQARWREITQSGRDSIMPVMRFSPCSGTQRVALIAASARRRSVSPPGRRQCDVFVHRDEPLRRVAEDHRLLRAPRVRVLVREPPARDQHAASSMSALITASLASPFSPFVGEHALAGKTGRLIGEAAVGVDGVGDRGVDAAPVELLRHSQSRRRSLRVRARARCAQSRCRYLR